MKLFKTSLKKIIRETEKGKSVSPHITIIEQNQSSWFAKKNLTFSWKSTKSQFLLLGMPPENFLKTLKNHNKLEVLLCPLVPITMN